MSSLMKRLKQAKGFTLTELIVVVTILGVLTAIAVPLVTGYIDDAEKEADNSSAKTIEGAVQRLVAKRTIKLTTDPDTIVGKVAEQVKPFPIPQQDAYEFYLDTTSGQVKAADDAPTNDWVELTAPAN